MWHHSSFFVSLHKTLSFLANLCIYLQPRCLLTLPSMSVVPSYLDKCNLNISKAHMVLFITETFSSYAGPPEASKVTPFGPVCTEITHYLFTILSACKFFTELLWEILDSWLLHGKSQLHWKSVEIPRLFECSLTIVFTWASETMCYRSYNYLVCEAAAWDNTRRAVDAVTTTVYCQWRERRMGNTVPLWMCLRTYSNIPLVWMDRKIWIKCVRTNLYCNFLCEHTVVPIFTILVSPMIKFQTTNPESYELSGDTVKTLWGCHLNKWEN